MDLISYLRVLKRRWPLVALPFCGALLFAFVTLPETPTATSTAASEYTATATLIAAPSFSNEASSPVNMATVALFAGLGEVPKRAAEMLDYAGEPQVLAASVRIGSVPDTGTLNITSTDEDPTVVAERVNAFARATTQYFREQESRATADRLASLNEQLDVTTRKLQRAERDLRAKPEDPVLEARVTAYQDQYAAQFSEVTRLSQQLGGEGPLSVLQPGVPIPKAPEGFAAPSSPMSRLSMAGVLGLLLGAALALLVERLDTRLRTREQAEDAYGLPVLAEIPPRPWNWRAEREIHSAERPASATAEAHRALRSSVLLLRPEPQHDATDHHLTLLVTSAQPGEGKTTTVANLAVVMAEAGRSVLVLSLDLRNPRIHEFFGVANERGMAEVLRDGADLEDVVRETDISGVRVITSGKRQEHPGAMLASIGDVLASARELADVVLIDTPPLLTVTDAVDIGQHVDAVLLTCRRNKTTYAEAASAFRLLTRLGLPAVGLVLVGSRSRGSSDGYRYGESGAPRQRRPESSSSQPHPAVTAPESGPVSPVGSTRREPRS